MGQPVFLNLCYLGHRLIGRERPGLIQPPPTHPIFFPAMSTSSAQLDCVLLNVNAYFGQRRNGSTATTRNHEKIEVSLCPTQPPLPSNLYVPRGERPLSLP
jgi:hypothetical protein